MRIIATVLLSCLLACACSSPAPQASGDDQDVNLDVTMIDFRHSSGAYVLGYSADAEVRKLFEDQLVADLHAREINAWPSHPDIPDATQTTRDSVIAAANNKKAMFIVLAEQVPAGEQAVAQSKGGPRITHEHPTLQDFYQNTRPPSQDYAADGQVYVEVSAYLIQEDMAKLFWSGTTWSFSADGKGGAIQDISTTIADAIVSARDRYLAN